MIIITGAAGFIGSCVAAKLNQEGITDLLLVDEFSSEAKNRNTNNKQYRACIEREHFFEQVSEWLPETGFIIHLGARTDTAETDQKIFDKLNLNFSKKIWEIASHHQIPLIYASSAATYGLGEKGYDDSEALVNQLQPLNLYGRSKNDFDKWALQQKDQPPFWAGLKFFNVYGPNEYHKGRMASVIWHCFNQIQETGQMKLFRSHHPDYKHGEQKRDFIYVMDVLKIIRFLMHNKPASGLYNLGTGKARTFWDLATSVFKAMDKTPNITFIDTPEDIRDKYQYFTQANINKLHSVGYTEPFHSLEEGIHNYVNNFLIPGNYY